MIRFQRSLFVLIFALLAGSAAAQILAENFRNINCANCRDPDDAYEEYMAAHPGYKITIVYYHNEVTDPNDPFYLASKQDVDAREGIYSIIGDPSLFINGKSAGLSSNPFPLWKKATDDAAALPPSPVSVIVHSAANMDGTYNVSADISTNQTIGSVKLLVLAVESDILFVNNEQYGKVPNDKWNNIFRKMLPTKTGTEAFQLSKDTSISFVYDPKGQSWNLNNLRFIGVVQENGGANKIYAHSEPTALSAVQFSSDNANVLSEPVNNPFSSEYNVKLTLAKPAYVTAEVYSMLGEKVATVANGMVSMNEATLIFRPSKTLAAGMYYMNVSIDGNLFSVKKLVYQP